MGGIFIILSGFGFAGLLLCLPLAFPKRTKKVYGFACLLWAPVAALACVAQCCDVVTFYWGKLATIIGLFLGIVPILPMALIASLAHAQWLMAFGLLFYSLLISAAIAFGSGLISDDPLTT